MEYLQQICNKYEKNLCIPIDEMIADFSKIKPTLVQLYDICIIKTFGNYIYNLRNRQMWEACPELLNEILNINTGISTL